MHELCFASLKSRTCVFYYLPARSHISATSPPPSPLSVWIHNRPRFSFHRSDSLDSFTVAETPAWLTVTARRVLRQISGEVTLTPRKPVASTRVLGESKEAFVAAPPWARIAYLIMTSGLEELHKTKRLIKVRFSKFCCWKHNRVIICMLRSR